MKQVMAGWFGWMMIVVLTPYGVNATEAQDRFEASLGVGLLILDSGNNLNPSGSKSLITDLEQGADRQTSVIPMILPSLVWDAGAPEGVKLFFNTEPPIEEAGGYSLNLGGSHPLGRAGLMEAGAFFIPFTEVWENPYLTGTGRQETDTSRYGVRVALNRIMGSGLRLNAAYLNEDVDRDLIGRLLPGMARDGGLYALNVNYSFYPTRELELRPRFGVRIGDYDGAGVSYIKYKAELEARYRFGRLQLAPRLTYSHSSYDGVDAVFGITREEDGYGVNLTARYLAPFGWNDFAAQAMLGYSVGDANIDFYDTEGITIGAFVVRSF